MKNKDLLDNLDFEILMQSKPAKIIVYSAAALATLFVMGFIFKITAHTVRGYNELKSSLKGN